MSFMWWNRDGSWRELCAVAWTLFRLERKSRSTISSRHVAFTRYWFVGMLFLYPFPFLVKPSTISCVFRGSLPGIAFLTFYAPLFLKINWIYRIFLHAQTSVVRPALVSTKSLFLISFGIISFQFLLAAIWLVSKTPYPAPVLYQHQKHIILTCKGESSQILMILNLVPSVIFMVSSTIFPFKTRISKKTTTSQNITELHYILHVFHGFYSFRAIFWHHQKT